MEDSAMLKLYVNTDLEVLLIEKINSEGVFSDWLHAVVLGVYNKPFNFV